jgi:DeoR family transcriptional regulator of aga operon
MKLTRKETRSTVGRRLAILAHLEEEGEVRVTELSESLGVSPVTIRNDLRQLERKNMLLRARGGAMKFTAPYVGYDYSLSDKQKKNLLEKKKIAKSAAGLIEEGNTIILDSGSTTFELAKNLERFETLTVITNAVNVANYLSGMKNINVIVPGGILRQNSLSLVGIMAERGFRNYFCDKLFLGVDAFDINHGLSTPNGDEAQMNLVMIGVSRKIIVVADSTKFQKRAFAFIAGINKINTVVTDGGISGEDKSKLENMGIEVIIA